MKPECCESCFAYRDRECHFNPPVCPPAGENEPWVVENPVNLPEHPELDGDSIVLVGEGGSVRRVYRDGIFPRVSPSQWCACFTPRPKRGDR